QINRAAEVAEVRLRHLERIKNLAEVHAELIKCGSRRADGTLKTHAENVEAILYWCRFYAWGYDPRPDAPLAVLPLDPFPFQQRYLEWLETHVFALRDSGLVEKARDMGATVLALTWVVRNWLFRSGFSAM